MKPPSCAIAGETAHQKSAKAAGIALRTKRVSAVHRRLRAQAPVTVGVRLPSGRFGVRHFVPMGFGNAVAIEFQHRWDDFTCDSGGNNVRDGRHGYGQIPGNEFQVRPSPLSLLREFAPEFGPFWGNPEILPSHCAEWIECMSLVCRMVKVFFTVYSSGAAAASHVRGHLPPDKRQLPVVSMAVVVVTPSPRALFQMS